MTAALERVTRVLADRYTVTQELGHGGMATVYLAEDRKHRRKVAIKVLKDDVSASVGATRFLREIEIAAQLQHPHILPLLDSGEADGILYYVMPYVEGQSLRQRIQREGELPVGEAVRLLVEVADALAYAHARGVVHRDIKPDNIMLTGRHAVVADFGVARAVREATSTGTLTSLGVALGTPAYMAPEQAVADPHVDQRADIYALGIVAYELLAGRTPFAGHTPQQMLAAQVTEKPDPLSRHRPGLPLALEQALMRCLEKRAADRFQSADDLLAVLEPLATPSGGTAPTSARLPAAGPAPLRLPWVAAGVVVVGLMAVLGWWLARDDKPTLEIGRSVHLTSDQGLEIHPDISPDGKLVAYAAGNFARMRIYIRPVSGGRSIPLSDDSTAIEGAPRWSPDGAQILFLVRDGVSVAPALGGTSRPLVPPTSRASVTSADWAPDGSRILFVRDDSLYIAAADGSGPAFLSSAPDLHSCRWSPLGDWIACVTRNGSGERPGPSFGNLSPSGIVLFPVRGGPPREVTDLTSTVSSPAWSADGKRLYFISNRDGPRDIYTVPLSGSGKVRGAIQRLTTGLGAISVSLAADAERLAYAVYSAESNIWSLEIPATGAANAERARAVTSGSQVVESVRASQDGRWIVYDSNLGGRSHIWRIAVDGGTPQQLTNGPADEFAGDLSPDGRFVAYHSWRNGTRDIEVASLDGGEPQRVTDTPASESYPVWSNGGSALLFFDQVVPFKAYVTEHGPDGTWSVPRLLATSVIRPTWSPDDSQVAYVDIENEPVGRILVVPAAGGAPREVYRPSGPRPAAASAHWSRDGRIYFKSYDDAGRASFWALPPGGSPVFLARLDDLSRPSSRLDFSVERRRLYFPIENRQSDVYVADIARKP